MEEKVILVHDDGKGDGKKKDPDDEFVKCSSGNVQML